MSCVERDVQVLEDCSVSLITERRASQPWGLAGGEPGAVGENWLVPGGQGSREEPVPDKCTVRLRTGDVLRVLTPGGGGWGRARRVRPMTAADVAAVQAVGLAAGERFRMVGDPRIARCADDQPVSVAVLLEAIERGLAWVSLDGEPEAIVGFLVADVLDDAVHVEEVAVLPVFGGRGHASAMLDAAAGSAGDHGFRALTLTTFRDVEFNRPLYERRGFRVLDDGELTAGLARRRADEDESGLPAEIRVCMRRDLG